MSEKLLKEERMEFLVLLGLGQFLLGVGGVLVGVASIWHVSIHAKQDD